jgi:hypothetical protein
MVLQIVESVGVCQVLSGTQSILQTPIGKAWFPNFNAGPNNTVSERVQVCCASVSVGSGEERVGTTPLICLPLAGLTSSALSPKADKAADCK